MRKINQSLHDIWRTSIAFVFVIPVVLGCYPKSVDVRVHKQPDQMRSLVERLRPLRAYGASAGGPYYGISGNEVTDLIIAQGTEIVPYLVSELNQSDWDESIYIVFCLEKLKAKNARARIIELQNEIETGKRFQNTKINLTLEMGIYYYLKAVDN